MERQERGPGVNMPYGQSLASRTEKVESFREETGGVVVEELQQQGAEFGVSPETVGGWRAAAGQAVVWGHGSDGVS